MVGGEQSDDSKLVLAKNADDPALNFQVVRGNHDGSHLRICRLETYLAGAFAIEALKRCFFAADQRHDDVTGISNLGLLANDEVPIHDVIFDHGAAFDLQNKGIAATSEITQRNGLAFFSSFQRAPRRDPSHQWKLLHLAIVYLILDRLRQLDDFDGAALIVTAANEAFFLERGDVLVHGGQRSELEALANFFEAGCVAVFGLERHEVIENFFLPFGECHAPPPLAKDSHRHFRRKESERQARFSFRVTFTTGLPQCFEFESISVPFMDTRPVPSASVPIASALAILASVSGRIGIVFCSSVSFDSIACTHAVPSGSVSTGCTSLIAHGAASKCRQAQHPGLDLRRNSR